MADRMIVMNGGVADQIGKPLEVYANPATEFVAGFIGSPPTNFMTGALMGATSDTKLGVRPEHMRLSETGKLSARTTYCEALGAETLVHLSCADGTQVTVRQDAGAPFPEVGAQVGLDWDVANEMRFDAAGRRV